MSELSSPNSSMEMDDTLSEIPSRSSTSSSSTMESTLSSSSQQASARGTTRPTSAPVVTTNSNSFSNHPPRAIRTAPTPTNSSDQNVRVVARVRPLSSKEINERSGESITAQPRQNGIRVASSPDGESGASGSGSSDDRKFEFDSVFGPSSTQREVYENTCGDMISTSIYRGFNATILAYGQTGSGKTFTMGTDGSAASAGSPEDGDDSEEDSMAPPSDSEGVIARAVYDLFRTKNALPSGDERVKVSMSYLEIYNEQAIDLLNDDPASSNATLQVRDSKTEGVVIPNLKHFPVSSPEEVRVLMEAASLKRATASTAMNSVSSRSHAICTLNVIIAPNMEATLEENVNDGEGAIISPRSASQGMRAKLTLVDLAGSERIKRTGAEGARMKEGININKGLFVLGQVVSALSELGQKNHGGGSHHAHIPYRDSKLTRLLQDSLGGNSKTVMIACISPAESNIEESMNTLRYAERTRNIKNSAVRNVVSTGLSASEAAALRRENQQLKLELARMESKMIVSNSGSTGFASGGLVSAGGENMETVAQLQAQCSSLLAENDLLKDRARDHTNELLEASLRADKWQNKAEAIAQLATEQGVELAGDNIEDGVENEAIVSQLRNELAECKADLLEARTEAAVARATAGAIISGKIDLGNIEESILNSEDCLIMASPSKEDASRNEQLTTELSSVSATIEQKEAMVVQMNKERACRDKLQQHFENTLCLLQTEVEALTSERDELVVKMSSSEKESKKSNTQRSRGKRSAQDPMTKKLRGQISKLEDRIGELKVKAGEHKRSMKKKEEAEKKCARLVADIAEDKRRRADLQRKLKETSVEMRAEKKAAQQKAAKMMKDSQKLKIELIKMKSSADKQAAVLKRKIDQASAKEKSRMELERKRRSAEKMRLASSSMSSSDVKEGRKAELSSWIDREFDYSHISYQIDEQKRQLNNAVRERKKLMKNDSESVDAEVLEQIESTIQSLKATVHGLEKTAKKAFPTAADAMSSTFRFLEADTFKGLSKHDAKYVVSYIFDTCSSVKQEMAGIVSDQDGLIQSGVDSALAKEQKHREKELTKIKMEHAEATLNLLESTQGMVDSNIKIKMDADGTEADLKEQVGDILEAYNESWTSAADGLKSDLDDIKEMQDGLQAVLDDMAKGMAFVPKKLKAKKKKVDEDYESEAFDSEESFMDEGDGEDSEYEPTPAKSKRKRRSPRLAKKATAPGSPASPIGENFIDHIDTKRVGSLKKACKKLGVPMTGKKADLKERVRETILNASMALNASIALHNPAEDNDELFFGSAIKKVGFEDDVALDPEFQPVHENVDSNESIKKKLWEETDDVTSKVGKPPKTPTKMTPCKRKKRPSAEKENANSATPKRQRPVGFLTRSPRPLGASNARTPVHLKQTIATSKKRLVPDHKQNVAVTKRHTTASSKKHITASSKKRIQRGMNDAVAKALQQVQNQL